MQEYELILKMSKESEKWKLSRKSRILLKVTVNR
jgi:hypothetical protein